MYILNPSTGLSFSWKIIKAMMDPETNEKINMLKPSEFQQIHLKIDPQWLE